LHDRYKVSVRAEHLDPYQIHDGLENLRLALRMLVASTNGKQNAGDMGFDTIVLSNRDSRLFDSGRELVSKVDASETAGQIYMSLNQAIAAPRKINIGFDNGLTWVE